jgi:hypothetical protein
VAELEALEYQLLADLLEGEMVERSRYLEPIRRKQAEIEEWIERGAAFVARARGATSRAKARPLIESAIEQADGLGLPVRLARAVRWLIPAPRAPEQTVCAGDR